MTMDDADPKGVSTPDMPSISVSKAFAKGNCEFQLQGNYENDSTNITARRFCCA
jgi:hypothetical protein